MTCINIYTPIHPTLHKELKAWHFIYKEIYTPKNISRSVYKTHVEALHFAHIDKDLKVERCVKESCPPNLLACWLCIIIVIVFTQP